MNHILAEDTSHESYRVGRTVPYHQSHTWGDSGSGVMGQNAVRLSNCRIL